MNPQIIKDVSLNVGPVRDQGKRPTCVAFALSDLHASVRSNSYEALSVEYLYYYACKASHQFLPEKGVTLQAALQALQNEGQPRETEWPYLPALPKNLDHYQPPSISGLIHRRNGQPIAGQVISKISDELDQNRSSALIFRTSVGFMTATANRPVTWSSSDKLLTPHAVSVTGLGISGSTHFVRVKNSWGSRWADAGYAWLSDEYVNNTFIALVGMV